MVAETPPATTTKPGSRAIALVAAVAVAIGAVAAILLLRSSLPPPALAPSPAIDYFGPVPAESPGPTRDDRFGAGFFGSPGPAATAAPDPQALQRACDSGTFKACSSLASLYDRGKGVTKNPSKAAELYQKACTGTAHGDLVGASACVILGGRYFDGEGVKKDPTKAAQLYEKACDGGPELGCSFLSLLAGRYESGEGVPRDSAKAQQLYRKACDGGESGACWSLGTLYEGGKGVLKDSAKAAQLYQKACDASVAFACWSLGNLYQDGKGVLKDSAKAAQLYQKACDAGEAAGCVSLGFLYSWGEGLPKSGGGAADSYYKAGVAYLKAGKKARALWCVESIQDLSKVLGLTVPNGFLADTLLKAIYQVENTPKKAPQPTFGTGWVIWGNQVVTNQHVVAGAKKLRLVLANGVSVGAQVIVSDTTNDLVLLKAEAGAPLPPPLPLAAQAPRSGETVFTIGHPYPTLLGSEAKVTDGVVSATSGPAGDPRLLQMSVPIQPGNSGGPLLNMRGQVVGIVVSKLNAAAVFRWSGDIPENVGYAIKLAYLTPLLPGQPPVLVSASASQELADLVARARPSIVLVVAE